MGGGTCFFKKNNNSIVINHLVFLIDSLEKMYFYSHLGNKYTTMCNVSKFVPVLKEDTCKNNQRTEGVSQQIATYC